MKHRSKKTDNENRLYNAAHFRQHIGDAADKVDLHIEHLTGAWEDLSNFEILTIQLAEFEKYYELAIVHQLPYLTVVHGVGKGKLREEIHRLLKGRKEVRSFENKFHPTHGYGATLVTFKY